MALPGGAAPEIGDRAACPVLGPPTARLPADPDGRANPNTPSIKCEPPIHLRPDKSEQVLGVDADSDDGGTFAHRTGRGEMG